MTDTQRARDVDELLVEIYRVVYSQLRDKTKEAIRAQNFENQLRHIIAAALAAERERACAAVDYSKTVDVILAAMKDYKSKSPDVSARDCTVAELIGHCVAESLPAIRAAAESER